MNNKRSNWEMTQFIKQVDTHIDNLDNSMYCLREASNHLEKKIYRLIEYSRLEAVDLEQINDLEKRVAELEKAIKIHGRLTKGVSVGMVFSIVIVFWDVFFWHPM